VADNITLIQLAPSLALLAFGATFAVFAVAGVSREASRMFAVAYLLGATVFTLDLISGDRDGFIDRLVLASLYTADAAFTVFGIFKLYDRQPPRLLIVLIAMLTVASYAATRLMTDAMLLRVFMINAGNGFLMLLALKALGGRIRGRIDYLLAIVFSVYVAQFFFRPFLTYLSHEGSSDGAVSLVTYISALQMVVGAFAILLGALTMLKLVLDHNHKALQSESGTQLQEHSDWKSFEQQAAERFRTSDFINETQALIIADVDGLKRMAEAQGADAAEVAVARLDALFRSAATKDRLAARLGDGAFVLVLRGERIADAMAVAEVLRASFAKTDSRASFGVVVRKRGEALASLLERADAALYLAKSRGGDAVSCDTDAQVAGLREALNLLGRRRYAEPSRKVA
jgi:diguanylate cyclase (GGDEF)-like protein